MKIITGVILTIYKNTLSFFIKTLFGGGCRFTPTCSEYAKDAIDKKGIIKGSVLSFGRILRCNPFGEFGEDKVKI